MNFNNATNVVLYLVPDYFYSFVFRIVRFLQLIFLVLCTLDVVNIFGVPEVRKH